MTPKFFYVDRVAFVDRELVGKIALRLGVVITLFDTSVSLEFN